jgi:hypothetical protein
MVKDQKMKIKKEMSTGRKFLYAIGWVLLAGIVFFMLIPLMKMIIPWDLAVGSSDGGYAVDITGFVYFLIIMTPATIILKWLIRRIE